MNLQVAAAQRCLTATSQFRPEPGANSTRSGSDADDMEANDMIHLARAEAEEAGRKEIAAARLAPAPPTPDTAFGHMPAPLRESLARISDWTVDMNTHRKFAKFANPSRRI